MAVAVLETDGWIQHLPYSGGSRPSAFGPVDGIWYGVVSGTGDNTGGNFTMSGRLSFDRKEDWVYILGAISTTISANSLQDVFTQVNTGPLIPTQSTVTNPSFSKGDESFSVANNNLTVSDHLKGGADPRAGMPIFGDKKIPGIFLMLASGWEVNIDAAVYQMSSWGFLIRYQSFFRNRPPSVG